MQIYFVAFDTSAEKFGFLKEVGGDVVGAGTGPELRKALDGIYQGKILAEAMDAGEREPPKRASRAGSRADLKVGPTEREGSTACRPDLQVGRKRARRECVSKRRQR